MQTQSCVLLLRGGSKKVLGKQETVCRQLAKEKNLEVRAVFREREKFPLQRRRVLRWLRAFCLCNSEIKFVISLKERSISRNAGEMFLIRHLLNKANVSFVFVKESNRTDF